MPTEIATRQVSPPTSNTVPSGRNAAIARSSNTRMARTEGVSRFPIHPRSSRVRAMTPDEEM